MKTLSALLVLTIVLTVTTTVRAQEITPPAPSVIEEAKTYLDDTLFAMLDAGQADSLAVWVTDQTHTDASGTTRMQSYSEFQTQFRMILQGGPGSPFGAMEGYDLIQQSSLPGTNRYFRLLYLSYHQDAPILWEIHFYVKPNDALKIQYFQFNAQNPFAYMTTPDMLIERYYR